MLDKPFLCPHILSDTPIGSLRYSWLNCQFQIFANRTTISHSLSVIQSIPLWVSLLPMTTLLWRRITKPALQGYYPLLSSRSGGKLVPIKTQRILSGNSFTLYYTKSLLNFNLKYQSSQLYLKSWRPFKLLHSKGNEIRFLKLWNTLYKTFP